MLLIRTSEGRKHIGFVGGGVTGTEFTNNPGKNITFTEHILNFTE